MPEISMGNTLRPMVFPPKDRLTRHDFEGLEYETLISCLAWYESSWRIDVYGDGGKAYSVMQFHKPTFEAYCEGDYTDPYAQIRCVDQMLQSDFGNISHWTTRGKCLE